MSANIFALANGYPAPETTITVLGHKVREPVGTVNMVPALANQYLHSGGKISESSYVSVCNWEEVDIYDGPSAKITV